MFSTGISQQIFFSQQEGAEKQKNKNKNNKNKNNKNKKADVLNRNFSTNIFFSQQEGEKLKKVLKNRCFEQEGAGKKTTKKQIF